MSFVGNGDVSIWMKYSLAGRYKCNQPINFINSAEFWWMVLSCKSTEQKRQEKNRKKRTSCWPLVRLNKCGVHRHHLWKSWRGGGRDPRWSYFSKSQGGGPEPGPPLDLCMNIIVCLSSLQTGNWTLFFTHGQWNTFLCTRAIEHFPLKTSNWTLSFTHEQLNTFHYTLVTGSWTLWYTQSFAGADSGFFFGGGVLFQ